MMGYLSKIKSICDMLEATCNKMPKSEQILIILNGLSDVYKAVEATIAAQKEFSFMDDVHAILLSHEARIESKRSQESDFNVNYAASSNKNKN